MKGWHAFDFYNKNDERGKKVWSLQDNKIYQSPRNLRGPKNLRKLKLRSQKNLGQERRHHLRWIGKLPRRRRKSSLLRRRQRAAESSRTRNGMKSAKQRMRRCAKKPYGSHGWTGK
jgi:hypothetical protein